MTSFECLHIVKLIKFSIPYHVLTLWNFFLQFSTFFEMKQYQLFLVISMQVEKQCSSPLSLFQSFSVNVLPWWLRNADQWKPDYRVVINESREIRSVLALTNN